MSKIGRRCPVCDGVDTREICAGLWSCFDCGDEFETARSTRQPSASPAAATPCAPPSQAASGLALFFRDLERPAHMPPAKAMFAEVDPVGPGLLRDGSTLTNVYLGLIEQVPDGWRFGRDGSTHATPEAAAQHAAQIRRVELAEARTWGRAEAMAPSPFFGRPTC